MEQLLTVESLIALVTLTAMEVVLGIDNIVFISILASKLPKEQQPKARRIGLSLAMIMRILLLLGISWVMQLDRELFELFNHGFSGKDLILLAGGLFLIAKATYEVHHKIETSNGASITEKAVPTLRSAIIQILLLDAVFSIDSVITAVGMAKHVTIMIIAVVISVGVMLVFAGRVNAFIDRHPTVKMLALAFLLLIGVMLTLEGTGVHVPKGYIYFAMAFSLFVEMLNMAVRLRREKKRAEAA